MEDDESCTLSKSEESTDRGESEAKEEYEEDVNVLIEELKDRAMKDSLLEKNKKETVDYTWEEITEGSLAEEDQQKSSIVCRPGLLEYIGDSLKPELNLRIPEPIVVPSCPVESEDLSTDSDEPPEGKKRVSPYRIKPDPINGYSEVYWKAISCIRYIRNANDLGIITTLTIMRSWDYSNEEIGYGILDCGGMDTLLNIALMNHTTIQISALHVLSNLPIQRYIKTAMIEEGVPIVCFRLLPHYDLDIVHCTSDILLKLSDLKCFRPVIRKSIGLEVMLEISELPDKFYAVAEHPLTDETESKKYDAAKNCLMTLKNCHRSKLVRLALYKTGFVRLLKKLIHSKNASFKEIGLQFLHEASSVKMYQEIFVYDGYLKFAYDVYRSEEPHSETAILILKTVYKCLQNVRCRCYLLQNGFFEHLVEQFIKLTPQKQMKYTLACLVEFLKNKKNRLYMIKQGIVPKLLENFKHTNARMREYSGRIVAELSRHRSIHDILIGEQQLGLNWLLDMCDNLLDYDLLAHVYKIVMQLSYSQRVSDWVVDKVDVIPMLWTAVDIPHPRCNEYGCSALAPYIGLVPDAHIIVRDIRGGIIDLLQLTYSEDDGAKAGAVTVFSRIANHDKNLAIIEHLGFIDRIHEISKTAKHTRLRYAIGLAFASIARESKRSFDLGKKGVVNLLIEWLLNDHDPYVHLGVVTGLWKLSYEKINCMVIIKSQIVERLIELMTCDVESLHNSVAGLLCNMRRLAREAEWFKLVQEVLPQESFLGTISDVDLIAPYQYPDDGESFN